MTCTRPVATVPGLSEVAEIVSCYVDSCWVGRDQQHRAYTVHGNDIGFWSCGTTKCVNCVFVRVLDVDLFAAMKSAQLDTRVTR